MISATHPVTVGWVVARMRGSADCYSDHYEYADRYNWLWLHGSAIAPRPPRFYYYYYYPVNLRLYWWARIDWVSDRVVDARGGLRLIGSAGIGVFTHIILGASGGFRLFSWSGYRLTFPGRWYYVGTTHVVMLPNMRIDWITYYEIQGSGIGRFAGAIEIVSVSAWETVARAGMTVERYSWCFLGVSFVPDVQFVVSGESRCNVFISWFPVGGVDIDGTALWRLHLISVELSWIVVDGTAGNPLYYDATLVVGSDSARGYSAVVESGSTVSTHMTLRAGQITVRVGGTRRIPVCYLVIPSSGASVWGTSAVTCQNCYV